MLKIILHSRKQIIPFNETARDLRIQNKPLWLAQRDTLTKYTHSELEMNEFSELPKIQDECIVFRDNLLFDQNYIDSFIDLARKSGTAVQAAFSKNDAAFREHCLPLADSYQQDGEYYLAELWYFPNGPASDIQPLVIDLESREIGYYHIPTYMASDNGDLVYHVPLKYLIAIDSWVHIFIADTVFGLFGRGARFENDLKNDPIYKLRILATAMVEGKQLLECSKLVKIGKNCSIDPSAILHGPTTLGDNVTIGAGVVIENCIIGNNVNISQGCNLMLSVIGDGTFLPFRASLFMSTIMDNSMIAQNACLQMCVIGRNSFVGAGTTFTDFNLLPNEIRARNAKGNLDSANRPVLGGCIGHNCRIGAGMIIFPARTIESDVVLISSPDRRVIDHDIKYENSDHHHLTNADLHVRFYPKNGEFVEDSW